jgi:murein L,D-transpeptidase YcbB/YkuD
LRFSNFVPRLCLALAFATLAAAQAPAPPPAPPPLTIADGAAIVAALTGAPAQGLEAPDETADAAALADPDPVVHADAEARLIKAAIAYAQAEHGADLDPRAIDKDFALRAPYDAAADFAKARAAGQIAVWITGQTRQDAPYLALVAARTRYAALVAQGDWGSLAAGPPLKPGVADPRVPDLRQRLAAEGYVDPSPVDPKTPNLFDAGLSAALADFQSHHALKPDGVLTPKTTDALNVSAADRLAAIDVNLVRARWLPVALPPERVEVDTAAPDATLFIDDKPVLPMRAIVGEPTKRTPSFVARITGVEFNPPWIVPPDIAAKELFPHERRSPGYFARNDFYVSHGQVIQRAGPKSALGYIKFEVPDPFTVYLHDTPSRSWFASDKRWRSHGCVRLQMPRELATLLLAPQGWTRDDVDAAIATHITRTVPLKIQPAVFVVYRTAEAAPDGKVAFRPDVYGWDQELADALAGHPESATPPNQTTTAAP